MKEFNQIRKTFSIKSFLAFLLIVSISCTTDDDASVTIPINDEPINNEETIKYLALGDSYTIGQGVSESERWPNQLVNELEVADYTVEKSEIIAQTGWKTSNLIHAIEANNPQDFNLVSLLIGVNNQFNSQEFDIFTSEFDVLIQKSINITGDTNRVFVVSIPDYGVTPFGNSWGNPEQIAAELDMYNNYMSERCSDLGIAFINITEISRSLGDSNGALSDGLHPSGSQYSLWVEEILPAVLEIVTE